MTLFLGMVGLDHHGSAAVIINDQGELLEDPSCKDMKSIINRKKIR